MTRRARSLTLFATALLLLGLALPAFAQAAPAVAAQAPAQVAPEKPLAAPAAPAAHAVAALPLFLQAEGATDCSTGSSVLGPEAGIILCPNCPPGWGQCGPYPRCGCCRGND